MRLTMAHFDHVEQLPLRDLIAYWLAAAGGRAMPARADIDPTRIPSLLPFVWLCDHLSDAGRFRYRLMGDHVRHAYRDNVTGRFLDEIEPPKATEDIAYCFRQAVEQPCVVHIDGWLYADTDKPTPGECILLPLASDGARVDMILGATVFSWLDSARRAVSAGDQIRTFTRIDGVTVSGSSSPCGGPGG